MFKYLSIILIIVAVCSGAYYLGLKSSEPAVGCEISGCHEGIEHVSKNHEFACIVCHGGNDKTADKNIAHKDMTGGRNPSDTKVWGVTCGKCHKYQYDRVSSTLMFTNTGMIKNSQLAWDDYKDNLYSSHGAIGFDDEGKRAFRAPVDNLDALSGELYRKFCSACHIGYENFAGYRSHHSSGCSACHFNHADDGLYAGGDKSLKGRGPYPEKHVIDPLPTDDVCMTCHNRSGRIALSYQGLYDGNNSLVPTKDGYPGPELIDGVRNVRHMEADIHHDKGMECIDCHTSRDVMGDGYMYENMYKQIETACDDCHGTENALPKTAKITSESAQAIIESANYAVKAEFGDEMVLTSKGRMYSNVKKENGKYYLYTKRKGKKMEIKTIKGSGDHGVTGHGRMECYTCHSQTVIQCYGCHTTYDKSGKMADLIKGRETEGEFSELEDFRSFFPFPLGLNQRGKISPVTPGCQTLLTVIDKDGKKVVDDKIFRFRGKDNFKFAPFYSHNTGTKAISCETCHTTLAFAGFGQGLVSVSQKNITSTYLCDKCEKPLDALYTMNGGKMSVTSDVVRENSRLLNLKEIGNMINANRCITCHKRGDKRIYGKKIDYSRVLSDTVHSRLLR